MSIVISMIVVIGSSIWVLVDATSIGVSDYSEDHVKTFYQVITKLRADVFLRTSSAYVGPFASKPDADSWIKWVESLPSLPDGYSFYSWEIERFIGYVESGRGSQGSHS